MSPKSFATHNTRNKAKTDRIVVADLNVIIDEMKKKEAYAPLYLLCYDD